jgi:hypothetical protein
MNNTTTAELLMPTKNFTGDCTPAELEVKVGAPVTMVAYSDRDPGTIMKVCKRYVLVRQDRAVRMDKNGMSESQDYRFVAGSSDPAFWVRYDLRADGKYHNRGGHLVIGIRKSYVDYSF